MDDLQALFKQGYKTTEFWVGLITLIVPTIGTAVGQFTQYNIDTQGLVTQLGAVAGGVTYIASRTWLKRKRLDTVAAVNGSTTPGGVTVDELEGLVGESPAIGSPPVGPPE